MKVLFVLCIFLLTISFLPAFAQLDKNYKSVKRPICTRVYLPHVDDGDTTGFKIIDSTLIETCIWRGYAFVDTGVPDYKGMYFYNHSVFNETDRQHAVKNEVLFNKKLLPMLEARMNTRLSLDFRQNQVIHDECLKSVSIRTYSINEVYISFFDDNKVTFAVDLDLPMGCRPAETIEAKFTFKELEEYFR